MSDKAARVTESLLQAAISGDVTQCRRLLETGRVHVDCADQEGTTPLILAAANGHLACVKELVQQNADPNRRRKTGASAVFFAAQAGHVEVLRYLLRHGGRADTLTEEGASALFVASQCGHAVCVRDLVQAAATVNRRMKMAVPVTGRASSQDRCTPLFLAAQNGHHEVAALLTDAGADPELARADGATPLWIASQMGHSRVVQHLLKAGAAVDTARHDGATPLFKAAHKGHVDVIKVLLRYSPNLDTLPNGETALHAAALFGHTAAVSLLLEAGASPRLTNPEGNTPTEMALQGGHRRLADVIASR